MSGESHQSDVALRDNRLPKFRAQKAQAFLRRICTSPVAHVDDLAERWVSPSDIYPVRPYQNRCDKRSKRLGQLLF